MGIFGRKKNQPVPDETAEVTPEQPATPGPKDHSAVPDLDGRVDLGSLRLRGIPGMQLRLEADQERKKLIAAHLVLGDSQMQVQVFAAPKTMGIWDEIRDEIAQGLATAGGTADEAEGPYGVELHARMPARAASGQTVFSPVRFVGIDGPRWFFRAVMSGHAAIDNAAAQQFYALLDDMVVVRGEVPMAPREVLALELPKQPPGTEVPEGTEADSTRGQSIDNPFERGPEITEIR
ncbi:MAG: DUF3710 domain-containing protein [Intrasporangiaceae bacterium]|nr:DUF3710 domain-containing protein [Intrasporangiaceae bacterium]